MNFDIDIPHLTYIFNNAKEVNSGYFSSLKKQKLRFFVQFSSSYSHYYSRYINFGLSRIRHYCEINLKNNTISVPSCGIKTLKRLLNAGVFEKWVKYIKTRKMVVHKNKFLPKKIQNYIKIVNEIYQKKGYKFGLHSYSHIKDTSYGVDASYESDGYMSYIIFYKIDDRKRYESDFRQSFLEIKKNNILIRENMFKTKFLENILKKEIFENVYKPITDN